MTTDLTTATILAAVEDLTPMMTDEWPTSGTWLDRDDVLAAIRLAALPRPRYGVRCDPTRLVAAGHHLMSDDTRQAHIDWCAAHGIDSTFVIVDEAITRDPDGRTVTWPSRDVGGLTVHFETVHAPGDVPADQVWPAPFPELLLAQPTPDECPTCGHATTEDR